MNYTNTNNKMTTVSKSDIKSIEKKCKMMIGDRYGENNEGGYGVSVKKTSFRNRKGKSVYSNTNDGYNHSIFKKYSFSILSLLGIFLISLNNEFFSLLGFSLWLFLTILGIFS